MDLVSRMRRLMELEEEAHMDGCARPTTTGARRIYIYSARSPSRLFVAKRRYNVTEESTQRDFQNHTAI